MLRFRLRTLFLIWTAILIPLGWIGYVREQRRRERIAIQELIRGRIVEYATNLPKQSDFDRFLFGDASYRQITMLAGWMPMDRRTDPSREKWSFTSQELRTLRHLPALKELFLHSSSITDKDLKTNATNLSR